MARDSEYSRLQGWAHRKGIARRLNYGRDSSFVETAVPSLALARYAACYPPGARVSKVVRVGRFRRRYMLHPTG